eukprot:TRINITY_DN14326_c0_g1_i4.p1 TRINITY_DN14326_c0_g1~~TRINITY_DN14326_c0_g1_i4.p1  ORF type:complete len:399 (-),score=15.35 TRINITY_DN14326_c0_g1_i4:13-1209(-)
MHVDSPSRRSAQTAWIAGLWSSAQAAWRFGVWASVAVISLSRPSSAVQQVAAENDNDSGVAVCLAGRLRALSRTLVLFQDHLFQPLQDSPDQPVDVFLYSPRPAPDEVERLAPFFAQASSSVVRSVRFDDESYLLESLGRDHKDILRKAMRIKGNWLGSTNRELLQGSKDRREGTGIFMLHAQLQCLDMIVFTRTDLRWIFPHPSLRFLRRDLAWIPDTGEDDWGGIYDKHLVLPRFVVDQILGGWKLLVSGEAYEIIMATLGEGALRGNDTNTERWLAVRLYWNRVAVGRFPMTAYVSCDPGKIVHPVDARVPITELQDFVCSEERDSRYPLEYESVSRLALCLAGAAARTQLESSAEAESQQTGDGLWSRPSVKQCYCLDGIVRETPFETAFELCD